MTTKRVPDEAPVVALFERDPAHSFFDVPTLLVWADGSIFYSEGEYAETLHFMRATRSSAQVREIVDSVISQLRDAPAQTSIDEGTDERSVQFIFRDGAVWRAVDVYGLRREAEAPATARRFAALYHQVLDWRPADGQPAPTTFPRPPRWPEELPTYPGQATIDRLAMCAYGVE